MTRLARKEDSEVVRGLEGVVAAETDISFVDGVNGKLYYKGYNIHDIAGHTSCFAEVAYLLLVGKLPTEAELEEFRRRIISEMRIPAQVVKMIEILPPSSHPMDILRTSVSALAHFDPEYGDNSPEGSFGKGIRLIAQIPQLVTVIYRIRRNKSILSPDPNLNMAANILYMLHGTMPAELHVRAMDMLLVLHADHGLNASTFAARVTASTWSDIHSAVITAIGTLKGPLHGGANERVMNMLKNIKNIDEVEEYINSMLAQGERVMGFGHRIYKKEDPRTRHLRALSRALCAERENGKLYEISHRIENYVLKAKGIYPNVDFYSATVQHALGIPEDYYTAMFAASRIPGWVAHVLEQNKDNRLIRPTSQYIGEYDKHFIPIGERTTTSAVSSEPPSAFNRTGE